MSVLRYLVSPGELAAGILGLDADSESRQILRMFVNTLVWSAVGVLGVAPFTI
jgi:hypothetical protein